MFFLIMLPVSENDLNSNFNYSFIIPNIWNLHIYKSHNYHNNKNRSSNIHYRARSVKFILLYVSSTHLFHYLFLTAITRNAVMQPNFELISGRAKTV